jgi:hypothetical protein
MGGHVITYNVAAPNSDNHLQEEKHQVPGNPRSNEIGILLSTYQTQLNHFLKSNYPVLDPRLQEARMHH